VAKMVTKKITSHGLELVFKLLHVLFVSQLQAMLVLQNNCPIKEV